MNGHGVAEYSHAAVFSLMCVSAPKTKDAGVNCSSFLIRVNYIYTVTVFFDVFLEIPLVVRNNSKIIQRIPRGRSTLGSAFFFFPAFIYFIKTYFFPAWIFIIPFFQINCAHRGYLLLNISVWVSYAQNYLTFQQHSFNSSKFSNNILTSWLSSDLSFYVFISILLVKTHSTTMIYTVNFKDLFLLF